MSLTIEQSSADRVVIHDVSWETYEHLLHDLENSSAPRLAYDQGTLEIMSPHAKHERFNDLLASIVKIALEESDTDFDSLGSTTFKREIFKRGFEPDSCFYIRNVNRIKNRDKIDLEVDPPPDLVIEIDLTNDSLNKLPLFATLGVPEVWRYKGALEIKILGPTGYTNCDASPALPILTIERISDMLAASFSMTRPAWLRQTRQQIHELLNA